MYGDTSARVRKKHHLKMAGEREPLYAFVRVRNGELGDKFCEISRLVRGTRRFSLSLRLQSRA